MRLVDVVICFGFFLSMMLSGGEAGRLVGCTVSDSVAMQSIWRLGGEIITCLVTMLWWANVKKYVSSMREED